MKISSLMIKKVSVNANTMMTKMLGLLDEDFKVVFIKWTSKQLQTYQKQMKTPWTCKEKIKQMEMIRLKNSVMKIQKLSVLNRIERTEEK